MEQLTLQAEFFIAVPVGEVTDHGVPRKFGVHAYLVRSARFQLKPDERVSAIPFFHLEVRYRPSARARNGIFFSVGRRTVEKGVYRPFVLFHLAFQKRQVYPARGLFRNLLLQIDVRRVVFGDDEKSRSVLIQTVHDSGTHNAVYSAQTVQSAQKSVYQSVAVRPRRRMYDHTLRLIDYGNILVLVDYFDGRVRRRERKFSDGRNAHGYFAAAFYLFARFFTDIAA